ncbi:glycoside hydrolase family 76 protein [Amanita thiersii Skay4041]|uniref:Glycoside hydrolase family 76 protein n=1 Tax=Amanita thiersii Skay4041 TaxID=703135 RepID=A0A2A9NCC1_9AGAR|nr:glycoside hydrolase family 76 protein [Amanita thiersii Skay4041]
MVLLAHLVLSLSLALCSSAAVVKRQCAETLNDAMTVANRLQEHYFVASTGQYTGGSLWTDANTYEDLHNLMLATGGNEFSAVADESTIGRAALNPSTNWRNVFGGSNDDAGWIVLSLWKMADYKVNRGLDASAFLAGARKIYDIIAAEWDNTCGGGVWWSTEHTYKNAVTNELFLLLSAEGFLRERNNTYLDNANKSWNWLKNSGMRNSEGLWNDGLDFSTCKNNGQTTWTYNQGVIASGLGALFVATGDSSLLDQAEITLDAVVAHITDNNILRESCDNAQAGGAVCNQDQQIFKGIWTKHVQYYLDSANDQNRVNKYQSFLGSQASGVFHFGMSASKDIGSVWYAPDQGGSIFTPKTSASGLAAFVSAAKYGPCQF